MYLRIFSIIFFLIIFACSKTVFDPKKEHYPAFNHDLSYIPYDSSLDNETFQVCDSTDLFSGRNLLKFEGGNDELREKIKEIFPSKSKYETFDGFVMVRFIMNCESETGRFRSQALNLDFTPQKAPLDLEDQALQVIQGLKGWYKSADYPQDREYSKFINLKFINGKIDYVIL